MWHNFNFPLNYRIFLRFPLRLTTCLCARCSVHQHDYVLFLFIRRKMYFCYLIRRTWHLSHYVLIAIYNGYRYRNSHPMLMIPSMRGINSTEWWRAKRKKKSQIYPPNKLKRWRENTIYIMPDDLNG